MNIIISLSLCLVQRGQTNLVFPSLFSSLPHYSFYRPFLFSSAVLLSSLLLDLQTPHEKLRRFVTI